MPSREDVVRLHHADDGVDGAPGQLDADRQRRRSPRRPVRHDAGRREQERRNKSQEQQNPDDERHVALLTHHQRMRVLR